MRQMLPCFRTSPQNDEDEMVLFDAGFSYNMLLASLSTFDETELPNHWMN